jgi:hypothetical protein
MAVQKNLIEDMFKPFLEKGQTLFYFLDIYIYMSFTMAVVVVVVEGVDLVVAEAETVARWAAAAVVELVVVASLLDACQQHQAQ